MSLKTTIVTDGISNSKKLIQCVCKESIYRPGELLLQCIVCKRWLHAECLGIDTHDKPSADKFVCLFCATAILVVQCEGDEGINNVPILHEDNEHIVCCCDEQSESGFMLQCERCGTWQHGKCMKLKDGESPLNYRCHICRFAKIERVKKPVNLPIEKDQKKEKKLIQQVKIPTTPVEDCSYVCKICGGEFDDGRALIYHKSYEKCSLKQPKQPENSSNTNDIEESTINQTENVSLDNHQSENSVKINGSRREKAKSYPKNILDSKLPKEYEKSLQNNSLQYPIVESGAKNRDDTDISIISSTHVNTQRNHQQMDIEPIDTIHDVHVTKLQNPDEISESIQHTPIIACGKCSLAFLDTTSLKHHHKTDHKIKPKSDDVNSKTTKLKHQDPPQDATDVIKCLCGSYDEIGVMVQCEICQTWQHTLCIGVRKRQTLPENYFCYDCMNNGCFSLIIKLLGNVTIENIQQKFQQNIVRESRKRKVSQSSVTKSSFEIKKIRRESQDYKCSSEESDESYAPSEKSLLDESYKTTQKTSKSKVKSGVPKRSKDPLSHPLTRSSTSELAAMKHLLSTILSETRLFTYILPSTANFKAVTLSEVSELLPTPINFPAIEITSDINETVHITSLSYLSSIIYPYGNQLVINVGAPVTSLAWVPAVFDTEDNNTIYLSITTQRSVACKDHIFPTPPVEIDNQTSDVVQIWSICNHTQFDSEVHLALGLILRQGKVMDMQWCPSGCFDDVDASIPRLGLLLVAMNTGELGIISVPHPGVLNRYKSQSLKWFNNQFYDVDSFDITLELESGSLDRPTESKNKCLCCDWSLQDSHNRVVAGFQNGVVAVWNLKAKLYCINNRIRPIVLIKAHATPVISVVWSPQHMHLFATASHDMYTALVWDMRQPQIHVTDLTNIQVCITWSMCWPMNYLRPICGIEVLPKRNEFAWYGNLITQSFRSIDTLHRHQLSWYYQQCPTLSSVAWCRKDCSLLLGSFSGELLFLYSFYYVNKTKYKSNQARKLIDISVRSDEESNQLNMNPFDIDRINAVTIDFDFSSFRKEEACKEFKCSDVSQEALIKRLTKPLKIQKSIPTSKFMGECKKCGKKFLTKGAIKYHSSHDVCKNGTIVDNRGNFFKPSKINEKVADKLMLQQLTSKNSKQIKTTIRRHKNLKSQGEMTTSYGKTEKLKGSVDRERCKNRKKPRDKYEESSHSQIKQVKWFPCEPYQNVFAVGTGLGLITVSYLPDT